MTPATAGAFADAALLAGQSYTDVPNNITVSVLAVSPTALSVQISGSGGATTSSTVLTSSPNPSVVGTIVTFIATVNGSNPTGTVNFTDGGSSISGCAASALSGSGNIKTAQCFTSSLSIGAHNITAAYAGDSGNFGSNSPILSHVVEAAAGSSLANASFEIPALGSGYQYSPVASGIGWSFSGGTGIEGNGSAWNAFPAPDGRQAAFIQGTSTIAQTVNLNAGSYAISFQAAQRSCCVVPYAQPIRVSVDGAQIGSLIAPPGTAFTAFSIPFSIPSGGSHTISFAGTDSNDRTTFIDKVELVVSSLATTSTVLTSSLNPSVVGVTVTFTATVTGSNPTGTVNFTDGGISGCATSALNGSGNVKSAQCLSSTLGLGPMLLVPSMRAILATWAPAMRCRKWLTRFLVLRWSMAVSKSPRWAAAINTIRAHPALAGPLPAAVSKATAVPGPPHPHPTAPRPRSSRARARSRKRSA